MTTPKSIGRYEIIDELGQGAMGSVFRARDPKMDRIVAVKTILSSVLASDMGDEYRERFYREARAAGALAHPGIVPVFDVGEQEGVPYLVMEFVRGRTLDYAMKKGERFSLERVCEIGEQIAEALGYAHRNGVIHRDIKPANILLTSPETYGDERPKITDFGVAKLMDSGFTSVGKFLGTPAFMSPEQFTGTAIDGRADLYSLGVILYWLATGEQPFPGESLTAISYKVVQTEPVPPAKLNPAIPARLESVILKCLKKNPAERYPAGEELAQDLALLREGSKTPSLQATAPLTRGTGRESEATFDLNSGFPKSLPAAEITALDGKPLQQKNTGARLAAAVVLLAAMAVGGGYLFLHRRQPVAVAQPQIPATMASEQPVTTKPPALGKPLIKTPETTPAANNSATATATNTAQTSSVALIPSLLTPNRIPV